MAIQDLDVTILHRLGKQNSNADTLSSYPLPESGIPPGDVFGIVAAVEAELDGGGSRYTSVSGPTVG